MVICYKTKGKALSTKVNVELAYFEFIKVVDSLVERIIVAKVSIRNYLYLASFNLDSRGQGFSLRESIPKLV